MKYPASSENVFIKYYFTFRPPDRTAVNSTMIANYFNLTMSYSLDADITMGYGGMLELSTRKRVSPSRNVDWKKPDENFMGLTCIFEKFLIL